MFTYSFDNQTALYIQLYNNIKNDIISGKLSKEQKLPSKRAAAKHLGVSVITVENAYAGLLSEGYIYSIPKKGYFVSEDFAIPQKSAAPAVYSKPALKPGFRYDFSSNSIIAENFPFSIWARLMRSTFSRSKEALLSPSPAGGVPELKQAICTHLKQFRNMNIAPEQVIIGAGTEYLYSLIVQLLGRDKIYAVQNPGYAKIAKIYQSIGVQCVYAKEDKNGIRTDALLKAQADIVHVSPSHHFPSGTVMSAARRHELLCLAAQKSGRYIIEDDYDSEFRLSGRPLPSLQSLDTADTVIYINTFTKSLSPSIRISYMVLPRSLVKTFYDTLGFYSCTVSAFEQYTLAAFISQGYFEKHINRMRNYYKKARNALLLEIQNSPLAAISEVAEEEAGLHFLLKLHTSQNDALLKQKAAAQGVGLSFLSEYYLDNEDIPEHILVMNYSALRRDNLHDAVAALANSIIS